MVSINDITITSLEVINAFDVSTGAYLFSLDELQSATISQGQETTDITGKQGRKLSTLKRNKTVTISGTNGLVSGGLLEQQTGGKFSNTTTKVMWADYLIVNSDEATTSYIAVGTAGAEIDAVYVKNSDGVITTELEQAATAAAGKFAYAPATKKLTFNSGDIADGTEIVVYYMRQIQANVLDNESDSFSGKVATPWARISAITCITFSSTSPRPISLASSLWSSATTRLSTPLRQSPWLGRALLAAPCGP